MSARTGGHIWLLDPESGQVMGGIHTGYHPDFALSPDGTHLFIASDSRMHTTELAVVDTSTGEVFGGAENSWTNCADTYPGIFHHGGFR